MRRANKIKLSRLDLKPQRVSLRLPAWMAGALNKKATHMGVTRQSLIKMWLVERLEHRPA